MKVISPALADNDGDEGKDPKGVPPYVECTDRYIRFLIENQAQMTPKHVSQAIWAIGRLRVSDEGLIQEMADIAADICPRLNAREISNIVWGLSKVNYDRPDTITKLVSHALLSPNEINAQEAANMLFALGKLQLFESDALFESLSSVLRNRLHEATPQAIANALWAHDVVGIEPPPELLSTWAQDRLGIAVLGSLADVE